ncbi:PHP domain-containing protein [Phormidium sp. LEGE 05292]|uniref:PHP domain-containing protein n=1 Tax=[Phormidium] sp. LEGE 05292 TaxID=767427 RepID=UPI001882B42E|nr:PHP domain-containing protein [Phormidium sp. LEGE 05292]MBE9229947.1 PHP domain-containing protein [Phormidium sp. LEGE 05292]
MLELHCHTTYSDGTLTPAELVKKAAQTGVKVLAITDHDTVSGWNEAIATAANYEIEIVPGIELSTVHNGRSLHILGFYPNADLIYPALQERLAGRKRRAAQMVANLAALGYHIELPELSPEMAPGRPHIAAALVRAGIVKSSQEAFQRWLGDDKPAYVHYEKFSIQEGVSLLRECGAVPVWAHPCLFRGGVITEVLKELVDAGLMGVEVYHPNHSSRDQKMLLELCAKYGLLVTGGSDYHGPNFVFNDEERSLNYLHLPLELLTPVKEAAATLQSKI